jgi:hypothetical protein
MYGTASIAFTEATQAGEPVSRNTSTGRTIIVIPVPTNEMVRADQNTVNVGFRHSVTNDLHLAGCPRAARQIRIAY